MKYIDDNFGLIQNLKIAKIKLRLVVTEKIILQEYKGSKLRGVFGWRLQKLTCALELDQCPPNCALARNCLYQYLFTPLLPQNTKFLKGGSGIPAPVLLEPPLNPDNVFYPGYVINLQLILIRMGIKYLPELINTFIEMGKTGLDKAFVKGGLKKSGGKFELTEVWDECAGRLIYPGENCNRTDSFGWNEALKDSQIYNGSVKLNFLTPVRFIDKKKSKKPRPLTGFGQFISSLYWRLLSLSYFHSNPWAFNDPRFHDLMTQATQMRIQLAQNGDKDVNILCNDTLMKEIKRWSNRSKSHTNIDGFLGSAELSGNLTPYLPLIKLGEFTHIGRQTTFGLGKYEIK